MSEKYTKKELKELYIYYNETECTPATKAIKSNYNKMHDAFNDYLDEIQEYEWANGFLYAVKLAKEGILL